MILETLLVFEEQALRVDKYISLVSRSCKITSGLYPGQEKFNIDEIQHDSSLLMTIPGICCKHSLAYLLMISICLV